MVVNVPQKVYTKKKKRSEAPPGQAVADRAQVIEEQRRGPENRDPMQDDDEVRHLRTSIAFGLRRAAHDPCLAMCLLLQTRSQNEEFDSELDAKEGLLEEVPTPPSPLFPSSGDDGLVNARWHNKAIIHVSSSPFLHSLLFFTPSFSPHPSLPAHLAQCYILNGVRDCLPRATPASAHNEGLCRDPMERTCPKKMKNLKDAGKSDNTIVQGEGEASEEAQQEEQDEQEEQVVDENFSSRSKERLTPGE